MMKKTIKNIVNDEKNIERNQYIDYEIHIFLLIYKINNIYIFHYII